MDEMKGGLAEYLEDNVTMDWTKVNSIIVEVKENEKSLHLLIKATTKSALNAQELDEIEDYIEGQMSDGWGDNIEQWLELGDCSFTIEYEKMKRV